MDKQTAGDERLARIEAALAHVTRLAEELSEVVARQEGELARIGRRVGLLIEREAEREADGGGTIPLADQRPPHW